MGGSRWSVDNYAAYSSTVREKTLDQVFVSRNMKDELNPFNIMLRESRDSVQNPNSTAIILGVDITGSMGFIAESIVKEGLGKVMKTIFDLNVVPDPHILTMAIGDIFWDSAPLQVTQFEADLRIAEQLTNVWVEKGGGGNDVESYTLPWFFAARRTVIDCFEKRGKKGYLFTMGDEKFPEGTIPSTLLNKFLNETGQENPTSEQLLTEVTEKYDVFHLVIEEGSYAKRDHSGVISSWETILHDRVIPVDNHLFLPEIITSVMRINEGNNKQGVIDSWTGRTKTSVERAVRNLQATEVRPVDFDVL